MILSRQQGLLVDRLPSRNPFYIGDLGRINLCLVFISLSDHCSSGMRYPCERDVMPFFNTSRGLGLEGKNRLFGSSSVIGVSSEICVRSEIRVRSEICVSSGGDIGVGEIDVGEIGVGVGEIGASVGEIGASPFFGPRGN